jgi:hypothetical protein
MYFSPKAVETAGIGVSNRSHRAEAAALMVAKIPRLTPHISASKTSCMNTDKATFRSSFSRSLLAGITIWSALCLSAAVQAATGFTAEKHDKGVTVKYNGELVTEYVINDSNKPYLWPVIGPTGKEMTRAYPMKKVDGEQTDHFHHRGIWFGHENTSGKDTWYEEGSITRDSKLKDQKLKDRLAQLADTKHREFRKVSGTKDKAVIVTVNDYIDSEGKKFMEDERMLTFTIGKDGARIIDYDIDFRPVGGPVTFGDNKDAGFNIRVPTWMAVDTKQGGKLINSEGITDKDAWSKKADWCDYSGTIDGQTVGIAMLDHPTSFRHPTVWHIRTYGLFTANPFASHSMDPKNPDVSFVLENGKTLKLRHRIILHKGDEKAADIAGEYDKYAKEKKLKME